MASAAPLSRPPANKSGCSTERSTPGSLSGGRNHPSAVSDTSRRVNADAPRSAASVSAAALRAPARNEDQASAGARSAPASLLHPWKQRRPSLSFHARQPRAGVHDALAVGRALRKRRVASRPVGISRAPTWYLCTTSTPLGRVGASAARPFRAFTARQRRSDRRRSRRCARFPRIAGAAPGRPGCTRGRRCRGAAQVPDAPREAVELAAGLAARSGIAQKRDRLVGDRGRCGARQACREYAAARCVGEFAHGDSGVDGIEREAREHRDPEAGGDEGLHGLTVVDLEQDLRLEAGDGARAAHQPVVSPAVALAAAREQEGLRTRAPRSPGAAAAESAGGLGVARARTGLLPTRYRTGRAPGPGRAPGSGGSPPRRARPRGAWRRLRRGPPRAVVGAPADARRGTRRPRARRSTDRRRRTSPGAARPPAGPRSPPARRALRPSARAPPRRARPARRPRASGATGAPRARSAGPRRRAPGRRSAWTPPTGCSPARRPRPRTTRARRPHAGPGAGGRRTCPTGMLISHNTTGRNVVRKAR